MPLVSVIVPVYNEEKYLEECLESLRNQTFQDFEVICVNDGSTDGCAEILKGFAAKDNRFKVITQQNRGLSAARNVGVKASVSQYVSYVDSDDFVHPRFLEILYKAATESGADITGCNFRKIYSKETLPELSGMKPKLFNPALDVLLSKKNFIHFNVWNKLYKREVISDIPFIEGIFFEDWVYNCCVFAKADSFIWINDKLYGYRILNNSIMRSKFNLKKLDDYVVGIHSVRKFYKEKYPDLWLVVRNTRVARTVKMLMNNILRSQDKELYAAASIALKKLYNLKLIDYRGLSLSNKIKLFKFLH